MDDTEYCIEHVFADLREVDAETSVLLYCRSMPHHGAVRELCHDGTVIKNKHIDRHYIVMVFM